MNISQMFDTQPHADLPEGIENYLKRELLLAGLHDKKEFYQLLSKVTGLWKNFDVELPANSKILQYDCFVSLACECFDEEKALAVVKHALAPPRDKISATLEACIKKNQFNIVQYLVDSHFLTLDDIIYHKVINMKDFKHLEMKEIYAAWDRCSVKADIYPLSDSICRFAENFTDLTFQKKKELSEHILQRALNMRPELDTLVSETFMALIKHQFIPIDYPHVFTVNRQRLEYAKHQCTIEEYILHHGEAFALQYQNASKEYYHDKLKDTLSLRPEKKSLKI